MFLLVLAAILAVIVIAAVPRIRRKLSPDARPPGHVGGRAPADSKRGRQEHLHLPCPDAADLLAWPGSMTTGHRQR
jgi:hypothetical protein